MDKNHPNFWQLKESIRQQYDSIKEVYCPYFQETVIFSSDGFRHLLYKRSSKKKPRRRNEQYIRLKLFRLGPKLLKITRTLQEFQQEKQFMPLKQNKTGGTHKEVTVTYWGFIAILEGKKVKVIVKQIGNGEKRFWSLIPNWITRKLDTSYTRIFHSGNPEKD